jgi:type IV secretion system protein TrbL
MSSLITSTCYLIHSLQALTTHPRREHWRRGLLLLSLFALVAYVLFDGSAWAATSSVGRHSANFSLFDTIDTNAEQTSNTWFGRMLTLVRPTFLILATIEICWAAAIWAIEKDNLNSLALEIIKKIMFFGFFFALLQFAPEWVPTITASFQSAGEQVTGAPRVSTDGIIATGLALIKVVWENAPTGFFAIIGKLGQIFVAGLVTVGIIVAFVVLAAQYFTLKMESYILFAAGAIFLGLGSSSWTKDYVSKYLNYAINVGVRLLVLILVLALMLDALNRLGANREFDYGPLLELLAVAILQAILGIKAPEMAGALLNGGIGLSAGSASNAASSSFGGLKSTMALAAGTLAKGVSAVQGVNNVRRAASAGREIAQQQGKSGAAATLGGLGIAAGQAAKMLPGKLLDAIKGKDGKRHQNPGLADSVRMNLKKRAGGDSASASAGGSGPTSTPHASSHGASSNAGSATSAQPNSQRPDNLRKATPSSRPQSQSSTESSGDN